VRVATPTRKLGALVGAATGVGAAFIVRAVTCSRERDPYWGGHTEGQQKDCAKWPLLTVAAGGGLGGGLFGALIGQIAKTDRWVSTTVERFPRSHR
jgi:hypothetical protein